MRRLLGKASPYLHLARVTTAFAGVGNLWFVILWSRAFSVTEPGTTALRAGPLWLLLLGGTGNALGLYAFGVCLNDLLDARRDRTLRPDRPVASGQVSIAAAVSAVALSLILAMAGATAFGTEAMLATIGLAAGILLFNAAGKFVPGIGLVMLGVIYAGHMLVPNLHLRFLWPVWLVMTHALVVAGLRHRIARKVPPISRRAVIVAAIGWLGWTAALAWLAWHRRTDGEWWWPSWVPKIAAVVPAVLVILFVWFAARRIRELGPGTRSAEKIGRYGAVWVTLYECAWLFGAGLYEEGAILSALALVGILGMTMLREWYSLIENPIGYQRV
ncbi:MAG: hypothetical protein H6811_11450 [Phycisphaeraceae bacterium]|nr:hypothetical protein [Phycisphaeraceae bacterium]